MDTLLGTPKVNKETGSFQEHEYERWRHEDPLVIHNRIGQTQGQSDQIPDNEEPFTGITTEPSGALTIVPREEGLGVGSRALR